MSMQRYRVADERTGQRTGQRLPLTPALIEPPTFTQVSLPSTATKPGPYAAQTWLRSMRFAASGFPDIASPEGF